MSTVTYLPLENRTPDTQHRNLLEKILHEGRKVHPIHGEYALMLIGQQMRFPMKNGFPLITERDQSDSFGGALKEITAFLNGAQTLEELRKFGLPDVYWARWVTKEKCEKFGLLEGDLGDASYGAVWTRFPRRDGAPFNQIENLVRQIKEHPELRTHRVSNFYPPEVIGPEGTRKVVVAPCHGDLQILVFPETKELVVHHTQRSGDVPTGVPNNMVHYAAFGMMLAQVTGYTFKELIHYIVDAHIYERQIPFVEKLLERVPLRFPEVTLDPSITDIFKFRREHFTLGNYRCHEKMNIPTPV